ncbi:MAG: hypothetical protein PHQ64_01500 [Bacilli bacterium]|nr:hypothetical protein [Bacilli bacterium]
MDKKIYLNQLYDYYSELFTNKQREYFENYYFDDLSLGEIAENNSISRNAVHLQIKSVEEKLFFYEEKLKLLEKKEKIMKIIKNIEEEKKNKIEELI